MRDLFLVACDCIVFLAAIGGVVVAVAEGSTVAITGWVLVLVYAGGSIFRRVN